MMIRLNEMEKLEKMGNVERKFGRYSVVISN